MSIEDPKGFSRSYIHTKIALNCSEGDRSLLLAKYH
jgi:hypothetical protein